MYRTVHNFLAIFVNYAPVENYQIRFLLTKVIFFSCIAYKTFSEQWFWRRLYISLFDFREQLCRAPSLVWGSVTRSKAERRKVESLIPCRLRMSGALPPIPIHIIF